MKSQTLILLIIAGACGLVAMLGIKQYMAKQNAKEEVPKVAVMVASAAIKPGVVLTEQLVEFKEVEAATCPEGVVTSMEQVQQRALKVPRGIGDWIMVGHLTEEGDTGITPNIPPGMRVMTIPVDATMTASGMLQPGNRIDLFVTYREKDESGVQKEKTVMALEYIEVFAVDSQVFGRDTSTDNAKARNISLLVDVEQAMKLTVANRKGTISTVLRSAEDMDKSKVAGVTEDILSGARQGELDHRSALDVRNGLDDEPQGFALQADEPNIMEQLQLELDENGPAPSGPIPPEDDSDEYWTLAIHEGGAVRVERVNLKSDEPIDTRNVPSPVGASAPTGPNTAGAGGGGFNLPPGFDDPSGSDSLDEEDLEAKASELLDNLF